MRRLIPFVLTTEQVLGIAPDAGIAKSARVLATPAKWRKLRVGAQRHVHGDFVVPKRDGFSVSFSLDTLTFLCTCKNRKFPCNHAVSLLLLFCEHPSAFAFEQAVGVAQTEVSEPEADQLQPRNKKRHAALMRGLAEFERWLEDLMRNGLATLPDLGREAWAAMAGRLVDTHAPLLALELRSWQTAVAEETDWAETVLRKIGRTYLLLQAFKQLDPANNAQWNDLHNAVGWQLAASKRDEQLRDSWLILGETQTQRGAKLVRQHWLLGRQHGRFVRITQVANRKRDAGHMLVTGTEIDAAVRIFASSTPLAASLEHVYTQSQPNSPHIAESGIEFASMVRDFSEQLTKNPWLAEMPYLVEPQQLLLVDGRWHIVDAGGHRVAVNNAGDLGWHLLATAGVPIAGLWDGVAFSPMSMWIDGRLLNMRLLRGIG